jgi:hypothetical protein
MQRAARCLQLLATARQVDGVVAVSSIGGASTPAHEPPAAQLTQVVRHQALSLAEELGQFPHGPVAVHELPQQPPTNRMCDQPQELRRIVGGGPRADHAFHENHRTQPNPIQSNSIDALRDEPNAPRNGADPRCPLVARGSYRRRGVFGASKDESDGPHFKGDIAHESLHVGRLPADESVTAIVKGSNRQFDPLVFGVAVEVRRDRDLVGESTWWWW